MNGGTSRGPEARGLSGRLSRHFGMAGLAASAERGDRESIAELCLLLLSENRRTAQAAGRALSRIPGGMGEICCDQLFFLENQPLINLCKEQGYLPHDPDRKALFWALTGDFSSLSATFGAGLHGAVARGYLAAGWAERIRVTRALAAYGRTDLLSGVLAVGDADALPVQTVSLMARKAAARGDYDWLAGELFSFPLPVAHIALGLLKEARFLPADGDPGYWEALYCAVPDRFEYAYPTGTLPSPLAGGSVNYHRVALHPAGTMLAAGCYDGNIEIWALPTGGLLHTVRACKGAVRSLEFSNDGKFLACGGSDQRVLIISSRDGNILSQFQAGGYGITVLFWLPGTSDLAVGGSDGSLTIISVRSGDQDRHPGPRPSGVTSLAAGADGRIFSGHEDGTIWHLDPEGEGERRFASSHTGPVLALAWSEKDSCLVSGSRRGPFLMHSPETLALTGRAGEEMPIHTALAIAPDCSWCAAGSGTGDLRFWSLPDGREIARHQLHRSGIRALVPTVDGGRLVAGTGAGFLHVVPIRASGSPAFVKGAGGGIFHLAASGDEILASLGWQGIIEVRGLPEGTLLQRLEGRGGAISCIDTAAGGAGPLAIAVPGGLIRLWDLQTPACRGSLDSYLPSITAMALLKNGSALVVAGGDGSLLQVSVPDGSIVRQFRGHRGSIHALALHPGNTLFAAGGWDSGVHLYRFSVGEPPVVLSGHRSPVTGLSFSGEGDFLVSCSQDRTLMLWETREEKELATFKGHGGVVSSVAFSPDSRMIASGSWDKTIRLWCPCDARCIGVLEGHKDRITSLAFCSRDILASGDEGGCVGIWSLPDGDLIRMQESHAGSVAGLISGPGKKYLYSAHRGGLCLPWHLPWTGIPRDSSPPDLETARQYLRSCSGPGDQRYGSWKFIEMLMAGELRSSIVRCPESPLAGGYEIELSGRGP
jgi:WD40 repeat protein